jgi:hypothetical protein
MNWKICGRKRSWPDLRVGRFPGTYWMDWEKLTYAVTVYMHTYTHARRRDSVFNTLNGRGARWLGFSSRKLQELFPFLLRRGALWDTPSLLYHSRGSFFQKLERTELEDGNLNLVSMLGMRGAVSPLAHTPSKSCYLSQRRDNWLPLLTQLSATHTDTGTTA